MITILLAMLFLSQLRRLAPQAGRLRCMLARTWPILALFSTAGCALPPALQSMTYQGHQVNRDQAAPAAPQAAPAAAQAVPQGTIDAKQEHAQLLVAQQRFQQKDFKGCGEQLQGILVRDPANCDARLLMSVVLLATQQRQAALEQTQEALKYHAENPDVQFAMGVTLDANGRPDEAVAYYERAVKAAPKNEAYQQSYRMAREAALRRKAAVGPENVPTTTAADGLRTPQVVPVSAVAVGKDRSAELLQRGEDTLKNGWPTLAAAYFQEAVAGDPGNPQIPIMAATAALKHNKAKLAVEILTPAAQSFPRSAAVYRCLAIAHLRMNDFPASKADVQQAIALDNSSALAYFTLGCALTNLGQIEAADAIFRQAATLDPRYGVRQ